MNDLNSELSAWQVCAAELEATLEALRTYKAPANGKPCSPAGYEDLADQLLQVASECDSSLHEVAGLAIKRLRSRVAELERERDRLQFAINDAVESGHISHLRSTNSQSGG